MKKKRAEEGFPRECLHRREKTRIFACKINISGIQDNTDLSEYWNTGILEYWNAFDSHAQN